MLSEEPEARGLAREVAQAAEAAAEHAGPEADVPLLGPKRAPVEGVAEPVRVRAESPAHSREVGLRPVFVASALLLVMGSVLWLGHGPQAAELPEVAQAEEEKPDAGAAPDAGTSGLGETSLTSQMSLDDAPISAQSIALQLPDEPLDGQRRPPCRSREVAINGGCWARWGDFPPPCGEEAYEWKGSCYLPRLERPKPPTSKKPH
jgi:hypothetical protein